MKKLLTLAMLIVFGVSMQADNAVSKTRARIDINSKDVVLKAVSGPEGGYLRNITWGKEEARTFSLTGQTALLPADQWIKATFVFIPENDGRVTINLMSNWSKDKGKKNMNALWVYYDMVTVEGGALKNGDFEEAKDNGKPVGWYCHDNVYVTTEMKAFSGNAMVKAWHNQRCAQTIEVNKDQQVTITVNVKMGPFEEAKE
ncbi:MAG: hypothetical protein WC071_04075 [Victivallaceae bacterium]